MRTPVGEDVQEQLRDSGGIGGITGVATTALYDGDGTHQSFSLGSLGVPYNVRRRGADEQDPRVRIPLSVAVGVL